MSEEPKQEFNVVVFHDLTNVSDIVLVNKGTVIARGETNDWLLELKVAGDVIIYWKDDEYSEEEAETYLFASEFPEKLVEFINSNSDWDKQEIPGKFELVSKNRLEFSVYKKKHSTLEKVMVSEEDLCGQSKAKIKNFLVSKYVRLIEHITDAKARAEEIKAIAKANPDIFL